MSIKRYFSTLLLLIAATPVLASNKLVYAVSVIRHGDRTPIHLIKTDPIAWRQGLGQLTPLGMQQEFNLGEKLRERLIYKFKLLPANYKRTSIYIRSSNIDRTLMSATSLLYGLYPLGTGPTVNHQPALPNRFQPIPIHTKSLKNDTLLKFNKKKFNAQAMEIMTTDKKIKMRLQQSETLRKKLSQLTQINVNKPNNLYALADNLNIRMWHHKPLPKGITTDMVNQLFVLKQWLRQQVLQNTSLGNLIAGNLLKEIANNMQRATNHSTKLKYTLYSAHDITILGIFSALGESLKKNPPYASELRFELYQTKENTYYVDTYYNWKPITIPHCTLHCTLSTFENLLAPQKEKAESPT